MMFITIVMYNTSKFYTLLYGLPEDGVLLKHVEVNERLYGCAYVGFINENFAHELCLHNC